MGVMPQPSERDRLRHEGPQLIGGAHRITFPGGERHGGPRRGEEPAPLSAAEEQKQLKALRGRFERGLLKWLRTPTAAEGPREMREAVAGIEARQTSPAVRSNPARIGPVGGAAFSHASTRSN